MTQVLKKVKLLKPALHNGIMRNRNHVVDFDKGKYDYMIAMGDAIDAAGLELTPPPPPLDRHNEQFSAEQLRALFNAIGMMNIPDAKKKELEAAAEAKIANVTAFNAAVEAEVAKRMAAAKTGEVAPETSPPKPAAATAPATKDK